MAVAVGVSVAVAVGVGDASPPVPASPRVAQNTTRAITTATASPTETHRIRRRRRRPSSTDTGVSSPGIPNWSDMAVLSRGRVPHKLSGSRPLTPQRPVTIRTRITTDAVACVVHAAGGIR
ncbi:hypothetical protein C3E77_11815 [Mycetocola zhujimingii]|nr:hypothetical protein C3E77_11815 [Mycetocola zhujimingii]